MLLLDLMALIKEIRDEERQPMKHSTAMATCHYFFGGKYDLIQLHRQSIHQKMGHSREIIGNIHHQHFFFKT